MMPAVHVLSCVMYGISTARPPAGLYLGVYHARFGVSRPQLLVNRQNVV